MSVTKSHITKNSIDFQDESSKSVIKLVAENSGALTVSNGIGDLQIKGVKTPEESTDAANKQYVDTLIDTKITGMAWKEPVVVLADHNVVTKGSASVEGLRDSSATTEIDGVTLVDGQRVLLTAQDSLEQNGIYVVNMAGIWERASDMDNLPTTERIVGAAVFVKQGTTYADTAWVVSNDAINWDDGSPDPTTGTPIQFTQFANLKSLDGTNVSSDITASDTSADRNVFRTSTGSVSVGGGAVNLGVDGKATTVQGSLEVTQEATLSSDLSVAGATTLAGNVVAADVSVAKNLFTTSTAEVSVGGAAVNLSAANATTTVAGAIVVSQGTTLTGAATLLNTLTVAEGATLSSDLSVAGATTLTGAATLSNTLTVAEGATLSSDLSVAGATTLAGNVVAADVSVAKNLFTTSTAEVSVGGAAVNLSAANATTTVAGAIVVSQGTTLTGAATLLNTLTVAEDATFTKVHAHELVTTSDARLKEDITSISDGLVVLGKLRAVSYRMKSSGLQEYGVVAQECQAVDEVKDLVHGNTETGHLGVNYNGFVGLLISAVQELQKRVHELESKT